MTGKRRSIKNSGFTLLEVLVAVSVMSVTAVITMQVISLALKNVSRSRDYSKLVIAAKNEMEQLLLKEDIDPGEVTGIDKEGYSVSYSVVNLGDDADDSEDGAAINPFFDLYEINLTVRGKSDLGGREFSLSALRFAKLGG